MHKSVSIEDALYGPFVVKGLAATIIQQDVFVRLKKIGQFGALAMWHPNGSYSRYQHCVGTWYLTQYLLRRMQCKYPQLLLSGRVIQLAGLAALLHDIGHGPMSHLFDDWIQSECPLEPLADHESRSVAIMHDICREMLTTQEMDFIQALILGDSAFITAAGKQNPLLQQHPWLLHLINKKDQAPLDVDNFDYINRDCLHLQGEPLVSKAEMFEFLEGFRVVDGRLCFDQDFLGLIKRFLQCRYDFHSQYYSSRRTKDQEAKIDFTPLQPLRHLLQSGQWLDWTDADLTKTQIQKENLATSTTTSVSSVTTTTITAIATSTTTTTDNSKNSKNSKNSSKEIVKHVHYLPVGVKGVWLHSLGNARFQILAGPV